jgi:hypothetical protein
VTGGSPPWGADLGSGKNSQSWGVGASWEWETIGGADHLSHASRSPGVFVFVWELQELSLFSPRFQVNIEGCDLEACW